MLEVADDLLEQLFDDDTLEKALKDKKAGFVVSIYLTDDRTLVGRVSSSKKKIYRCQIALFDDKHDINGAVCTCSIWMCRHVAATLLTYVENPKAVPLRPESGDPTNSVTARHTTRPVSQLPAISIADDFFGGFMDSPLPTTRAILSPRVQPQNLGKEIPTHWSQVTPDLNHSLQWVADSLLELSEASTASGGETKTAPVQTLLYIIQNTDLEYHNHYFPLFDIILANIKKDGSFGSERKIEMFTTDRMPPFAKSEDQQIFQLATSLQFWATAGWQDQDKRVENLFATCQTLLINSVLATGRCKYRDKQSAPLTLGPALPGKLIWEEVGFERLRLKLVAEGEAGTHTSLSWRQPWYINSADNLIGPIKFNLPWSLMAAIRRIREIKPEEAVAVTCKLADLGLSAIIPEPPLDKQKVQVRLLKPKPKLVVTELADRNEPNYSTTENRKNKGGERTLLLSFPPDSITDKMRVEPGGLSIIEKQDKSSNRDLIEKIVRLGFEDVTDRVHLASANDHFFMPINPFAWASFEQDTIKDLRASGIDVLQKTEQELSPISISEKDMRISIKDDNAFWMTMEFTIDVNGRRLPLLPILKSALKRLPTVDKDSIETLNRGGKFSTPIEGGTIIAMPFERIRTILLALQEILDQDSGGQFRVSYLHVSELLKDDALSDAKWSGDSKVKRFVNQLSELRNLPTVQAPKGFKSILRPYQLEGLAWLQFLASHQFGGILADDMGLGKTAQLLAHTLLEKEQGRLQSPVLVVCPTSVLPNWASEIDKFTPSLKKVIYAGTGRTDPAVLAQGADIVLTTYGLLSRDIERLKKIQWHGVILDEAQCIKNPQAKVAQAARSLKCGHKFCLTGTPVQNHLGELWSEFAFLMPGLLGDKTAFERHIRVPIEKEDNALRRAALAARIRPFVLRRAKADVLDDLPEKSVIVKRVELQGPQRDLYETVRLSCTALIESEIAAKGFKKSQLIILEAMLKLRQICCDPKLIKIESAGKVKESAKLETLIEMIDQMVMEGRKILVFSQFTGMLDLVANELISKNIDFVQLRGDTRDRAAPVAQFQETAVPVFLISLKAGGVGLNLTAADTVIHYDPWWNPAAEDQATDRAYRIGQDKHVFVYKLIANGTIEDWMLDIQERKRILAASIYDDKGNLGGGFHEEDLAVLFKPLHRLGS